MRNGAVGQLAEVPVMIPGAEEIVIRWGDGHRSRYRVRWLRDCCPCDRCAGDGPGKRLADLRAVPCDPRPGAATIVGPTLVVRWDDGDHTSHYALDWLQAHCCCPTHLDQWVRGGRQPVSWGTTRWTGPAARPATNGAAAAGPAVTSCPAPLAWSAVADDDRALADWLSTVVTDGWARLTGVGVGDGGGDAALLAVVARFGYVRETNDGRVFDVRTGGGPIDGRPAVLLHTDNPYRQPVPSLRLLHCTTADPADPAPAAAARGTGGGGIATGGIATGGIAAIGGGAGGETVVVDGFCAADVLRAERPEAFAQLATWPVRWRYADDHVDLVAEAPVVELGPGGAVVSIRFDERSREPLQLDPDVVDQHLLALRRFASILDRPQLQVRLALDPGDVVLLDSRRMLHGHTASGSAGTHLRGCYADRDGLESRLAVLRRGDRGWGAAWPDGPRAAVGG